MSGLTAPILLDTHTWIWVAGGESAHFRKKAIDQINAAAQKNRLLLAAISLWEVAMLESKGRIKLAQACGDWLQQAQRKTGVMIAPLDAGITALRSALPGFHGDPADRLIVAAAIHHGAILMTEDAQIVAYARKGRYRVSRLK